MPTKEKHSSFTILSPNLTEYFKILFSSLPATFTPPTVCKENPIVLG